MVKTLLLGKNGQVGQELLKIFSTQDFVALDRTDVDLANPKKISEVLRYHRPQVIINGAAYTAVDLAEKEVEAAFAINAHAPEVLAEEAKKLDALLIHYSTDYVFDGAAHRPYLEEDPTAPINVYGTSKRAGEQAIATIGCKHYILRTSWVYGTHGKNFLLTMLRLAKERDTLKIVNDQIGAPTWSREIAQATEQIVGKHQVQARPYGIYHLTSSGAVSWYQFAQAIFNANPDFKRTQLVAIPSSEYPTPAKRPKNSQLSNQKLLREFGLALPHWEESLKHCLKDLI